MFHATTREVRNLHASYDLTPHDVTQYALIKEGLLLLHPASAVVIRETRCVDASMALRIERPNWACCFEPTCHYGSMRPDDNATKARSGHCRLLVDSSRTT